MNTKTNIYQGLRRTRSAKAKGGGGGEDGVLCRCPGECPDGELRMIVSGALQMRINSKRRQLGGAAASKMTVLVALLVVSLVAMCSGAVLLCSRCVSAEGGGGLNDL